MGFNYGGGFEFKKQARGMGHKLQDLWLGDPFGDRRAARQRQRSFERGLQAQGTERDAAMAQYGALQQQGLAEMYGATGQGAGALDQGYAGAQQGLQYGLQGQMGAYGQGRAGALGQLGAGFGQARGDLSTLQGLQGYAGGATRAIDSYDVTGQESELARLQREGIEGDAGYQFRRQQGEEAINAAASARGGRMSGRTLKELSSFNQGLASDEFDRAAQRASQIDTMRQQALMNQAGRSDAAAMAAQQNQMALAGMGYGAQGQLAQLAAQQGQLGAGVESQYGSQMGQAYGQYGQSLAGASMQRGQSLADLYGQAGQQALGSYMGVGEANNQLAQQMMQAYGQAAGYGGEGTAAQGGTEKGLVGGFLGKWLGSGASKAAK